MKPATRTRYPGLASFTTAQKDIFFGRAQESRDLTNLISVERTVVLFSKSGYGKTSLLQAGVMPLLYSQMVYPVLIRFGTDAIPPEEHFKLQFEDAYRRFLGDHEQRLPRRVFNEQETFWEQIQSCPFGEGAARFTPLLIFDQFEELFTLYANPAQRRRFVLELADLIHERLPAVQREHLLNKLSSQQLTPAEAARLEKAPPMKFVFSIRSDMLHFMDELTEQIPYILRSRYQLFGLNEAQSTEAIVAPAALESDSFESLPFAYEPAALQEILGVLSKNREVESFQLQSICQAIEEKVNSGGAPLDWLARNPEGLPLINSEFYGGREGIDRILEESYNRRLEGLARFDPTWTEAAHLLLEDALVNKNDRRQSVDSVSLLDRPGVSQALLDELERQRLVRREPRLESFYYEISHDTWLKPVLRSRNVRWEAEKLQRLRDEAAEAKRKADRERRRRGGAYALSAVSIAGLLVAVWFYFDSRRSQRLTERSEIAAVNASRQAEAEKERATANATLAETNLIKAKQEESRAKAALEEVKKQRAATEEQRRAAVDALREAEMARKKAETLALMAQLINTKKLPEHFDGLVVLDSLNCENWEIRQLSPEIGKLTGLRLLNLRRTRLTKLPSEIGALTVLRDFNVSYNDLRVLPPEIGNLTALESFDFNNNKVMELPPEIGRLKNLRSLNALSNKIIQLPPEIGNFTRLEVLNLWSNNIDSLPASIGKCQSLQSLNLAVNTLKALPDELANCHSLRELYLSRNYLRQFPLVITRLEQLTRLEIGKNNLGELPHEIGRMTALKSLNLEDARLTSLPPEIGLLSNLEALDLDGNRLTALPPEIAKLTHLTHLDLDSNPNLESLPPEIIGMKNLERITLRKTGFNLQSIQALKAAMPWCSIYF